MEGVLVIKKVSVKLFSFFNGGSIGDQENVCQTLELLYWREYWWSRTCLSNSSASSMEGVLVMKNVSVKLFSFFSGGSIGDQERVCQTLQLHQWREYWWWRTCLSNSSVSCGGSIGDQERVFNLFSFINGGSIGDEERVCQTLQLLQWREYWWSRTCLPNFTASSTEGVLVIKTCLSNSSASSMEGVLVMKNVSVKLFSFFSGGSIGDQERVCQTLQEGVLVMKNVSVKLFSFFSGGSIGDQERVCQTLQLHQWREYWWSRTCLSNSSASLLEGVLVIKRVCQTLQLLQWREYWWSRICLSNSSASLMEGVLVIKKVSVKLFSFFNGGVLVLVSFFIGGRTTCLSNSSAVLVQERVCQTLQLHQWREYWWWRTCLSNSLSFFNGGSIGDEERVCQTLQFLRWRQYWWSRTCLSISSVSSMEGVLVMKNVSVKLFSFFNGGSIGDQNVSAQFYSFFNGGSIGDEERVCQTLQFLQWRQYWWSRTCLSNSSASSMEGVLVMKNVSVKLFSFFSGGSIGDQERVCQTLQLHQWREYWWWRTCLSNSSASLLEGVLVIKNVSVKLFNFFNGGSIGDQENVCQTLELLYWREYWWSRTCLSNSSASSTEGVLVTKDLSVKLFSFFGGGSIGDQERVCQTLQLLYWRECWWARTCLSNSSAS